METAIANSSLIVKSYRDLKIWQEGINLTKEIYLVSANFPSHEVFGLTNQLRRAAVSVPSNIAEGQARQHTGEFVHFLHISLGSLAELDTQIVLAKNLGYITSDKSDQIYECIQNLRRMIFGLIKKLKQPSASDH